MRVLVALAMQADRGQQLSYTQMGIFRRLATETESDVLFDGKVREQRVILKDHADAPLFRRYALPRPADCLLAQADFAIGDFLETGDAAQQGGLAAARRAQQAGNAASLELKVDPIDDGLFSVALNDAIEFKLSHSG